MTIKAVAKLGRFTFQIEATAHDIEDRVEEQLHLYAIDEEGREEGHWLIDEEIVTELADISRRLTALKLSYFKRNGMPFRILTKSARRDFVNTVKAIRRYLPGHEVVE